MTHHILLISTLVILWWISIWGLVDITLTYFLGPHKRNFAIVYISIIVFVISIVSLYPDLVEKFV
jgi:hypothetical protein